MDTKKMKLLYHTYLEPLRLIDGIKLTYREIEIIAFFVCGRSVKKIASFFSISPKTVENHTHNIMLKLGCNSRESIIDFIEKSNKLSILRQFYTLILSQATFERHLKEIAKLAQRSRPQCHLVLEENSPHFLPFFQYLEASLNTAGIYVSREKPLHPETAYTLFLTPERLLFCLPGGRDPLNLLQDQNKEDWGDLKNLSQWYLLSLEILKILLPRDNLEGIIENFKKSSKELESLDFKTSSSEHGKEQKNMLFLEKKGWVIGSLLLIISGISWLKWRHYEVIPASAEFLANQKKPRIGPIRSELVIPIASVRLERPELISQFEERFKGWNGIQTVALVGVEGSGKTVLAHQYASSQALPYVWEINAETQATLHESFEHLAQALATTEEDQKILTGILKEKSSTDRGKKLIQFVQERLRMCHNWLLIYDNVERFSDIQQYFPKDSGKWGQGRIVLTTRDSNIENNRHINNVILIGSLDATQKLDLFSKIMNTAGVEGLPPSQKEATERFLAEIPPFPLDVSIAAYYIKATHVPYKKYLESMLKYSQEFSEVQTEILQEAGEYIKTRYSIITLTITQLIAAHRDFKDLLLCIALLDSQNIPRDLLIRYKGDIVVDSFIRSLKKYSLIMPKTWNLHESDSVFSIHRSIQAMILAHLAKALNLKQDKALVKSISSLLEAYMNEATEKEDFSRMKLLHHHAEQLLSHEDLLSENDKWSLKGELGCICCYLCFPTQAKQLLEESLSKLQASRQDSYKVAHFLVYLGNVHRKLGNYEKAKDLFQQSLTLYKNRGSTHAGMARAAGYLGVVYENLGDFEKAKVLLEKSLMIYENSPQNGIGLAWSLAHLGSVHKNLGDYGKAKDFFERSLTLYRTYSANYVGAAWTCGDLGSIYVQLGKYDKAKAFLEESLRIYTSHFSEDHIYVAKAFVHLGNFYRETGNYEKAKTLLTKGLIAIEGGYGKDHAETGVVLRDLAHTHLREGNLEVSEPLLKKALEIFEKRKNPEGYGVLELFADLSLKKAEKKEKESNAQEAHLLKMQAIACLTQALKIASNHFPSTSPHFARIQAKLSLAKKGRT